MTTPQPTPARPAPFTQRTVLLLFVAVTLGCLVGVLTFVATPVLATAVIAGLVTAGAVLVGGHQLIE
ncbi:hypothetical protein [Quadrisphaera setariae]|uniref:Uncharacterized protein n=1 Tax=Quadrisphaera setariae TaxID=2593304 RepID=A0A5C8Z2W9_9ACTN|nr:hypothetical protein [Quadrisphaera setariae]TXR51563.1 hypothetical protein FMM08_22425 [Quadrisphaera setariae]